PLGRFLAHSTASRGSAKFRGHLTIVLPAQLRILVDEEHMHAVARRGPRRGEPRWSAAHHHALHGSHRLAPHSPRPRCVSTPRPSRTGVMHARTFGAPSTVTRQSWQTPIPQK